MNLVLDSGAPKLKIFIIESGLKLKSKFSIQLDPAFDKNIVPEFKSHYSQITHIGIAS